MLSRGGRGRLGYFWSKIGLRPSEARYSIDVVNQQMAQLHEIEWAPDCETSRIWIWVLDTGVTEHGAPSMGASRKYGVTDIVVRASGGNERVRKHKIVSISNANSQFYDSRTLDGSTPEGSAVGFDMGIITDSIRLIDGWQRWIGIIIKYGFVIIQSENRQEQADILEV